MADGGINPPDLFFREAAVLVPVRPETTTPQGDKAEGHPRVRCGGH